MRRTLTLLLALAGLGLAGCRDFHLHVHLGERTETHQQTLEHDAAPEPEPGDG